MPLYTSARDRSFFRHANREMMRKIVSQEVVYYKISLSETVVNVFGESKNKMYHQPMLLVCSIIPEDPDSPLIETGLTTTQQVDFRFLTSDLIEINLVPEKGDIIMWEENYYEVDNMIYNQRVMGKNPDYSIESDNEEYGEAWSVICKSHLTKPNKLNIIKSR